MRVRNLVISGVQIVVVSGNVFGLFYEFSKCSVEELDLFSFYRFLLRFGRRIRVGTFYIFKFEIARIAIRNNVKSAEMAVMFGLFVFLSELTVKQFAGCSVFAIALNFFNIFLRIVR